MAIPSFRIFLRPVLEIVASRREVQNARRSLIPIVQEKIHFSDAEAAERLDSAGNRLANRVAWALTYLTKSGLIEFPKRGLARITPEGEKFLASHAGEIAPRDLEVFPGYLEFKESCTPTQSEGREEGLILDEIDPEELINLGFREIKKDVAATSSCYRVLK